MKPLLLSLCLPALFASLPAQAAEHRVKMLTQGQDGLMVFEPAYLKARPGDTVIFEPTQKGAHNSASLLLPPGAKAWRSGMDVEHRVKLDAEGIYLYVCDPHKSMGMVGVLQVGKPVNLAEAKARADQEQARFGMGKDRFSRALAQVK